MQQTAHPPGTAPPFGSGSTGDSSSTTDQAKDKAQQAAGQAQEKVQQGAQQAKSRLQSEVDTRSTKAGEQVSEHASHLRSVSETLREKGEDGPAKMADQAADRIERVGGYLTETNGEKLLHDLEDAARQRPWAVVAAGLAAGFAASRFLKASSSDRYQTRASAPSTGSGHFGSNGGNLATTGDRFNTPAPTAHPTTPAVTPGTPEAPIVPAPSGGAPGTAGPGGL